MSFLFYFSVIKQIFSLIIRLYNVSCNQNSFLISRNFYKTVEKQKIMNRSVNGFNRFNLRLRNKL
jgi:hypothetical protein